MRATRMLGGWCEESSGRNARNTQENGCFFCLRILDLALPVAWSSCRRVRTGCTSVVPRVGGSEMRSQSMCAK